MQPPGMKRLAQTMSAPCGGLPHHVVENGAVEIVVGGKDQHERRLARGKAAHHRAMRAAPAIENEIDGHAFDRAGICLDRRKRIVVGPIVADENARRRAHLPAQRGKRRQNVLALVIDGNDDIEARGGGLLQRSPLLIAENDIGPRL